MQHIQNILHICIFKKSKHIFFFKPISLRWLKYIRDFRVMQGETQQAYSAGKKDSCHFEYRIVDIFSDTKPPI